MEDEITHANPCWFAQENELACRDDDEAAITDIQPFFMMNSSVGTRP